MATLKCISCFWASAAIFLTVRLYSLYSVVQHFHVLFECFVIVNVLFMVYLLCRIYLVCNVCTAVVVALWAVLPWMHRFSKRLCQTPF